MAHELPDQSDLDAELAIRVQMDALIANLDFVAEFEAEGHPYSELHEGRIVTHYPRGAPEPPR